MKIEAKSILSSKDSRGNTIHTLLVTYPRIIHSEIMTHRLFSRNSASSRAIPFEKMVESVEQNPFIPIAWQKDHKGMQGNEYFENENEINYIKEQWLKARDSAVNRANLLSNADVTKQLCNRLLEPFMWHTVLITSTEWENFFELRCPRYKIPKSKTFKEQVFKSRKDVKKELQSDGGYINTLKLLQTFSEIDWLKSNEGQAEIHMMALAEAMYDCINEAKVQELKNGQWHIPFIENLNNTTLTDFVIEHSLLDNQDEVLLKTKIKIATARCARISYTTVGDNKESSIESDLKLHDRLMKSGHWSPFEHIAQSMSELEYYSFVKGEISTVIEDLGDIVNCEVYATGNYSDEDEKRYGWCNNFKGFIQYRYQLENKK